MQSYFQIAMYLIWFIFLYDFPLRLYSIGYVDLSALHRKLDDDDDDDAKSQNDPYQ